MWTDRQEVVPVYGLTPYPATESHGASRELVRAFGTESERHRGRAGRIMGITNTDNILLVVAVGLCSLLAILRLHA